MTPVQIVRNRKMVARLMADPAIRATIARNTFPVAGAVTLVLDMNVRAQDFRHRVAFQWCEANAAARWRRRVFERRGNALFDRVVFEFEARSDAYAFDEWRTARGW